MVCSSHIVDSDPLFLLPLHIVYIPVILLAGSIHITAALVKWYRKRSNKVDKSKKDDDIVIRKASSTPNATPSPSLPWLNISPSKLHTWSGYVISLFFYVFSELFFNLNNVFFYLSIHCLLTMMHTLPPFVRWLISLYCSTLRSKPTNILFIIVLLFNLYFYYLQLLSSPRLCWTCICSKKARSPLQRAGRPLLCNLYI